jgi:MFS family permease
MSQEQEQVHASQKANVPFRREKASLNGTVQAQEITLPSKWAVLAILAIGIFMSTLDSSIVNISLPTIARYFGVPLNGAVEWVIIAYLVAIAGTLLTIGRLADMIGRKALWVTGLGTFALGSAICGAAPRLDVLIAARAFQGIGAL